MKATPGRVGEGAGPSDASVTAHDAANEDDATAERPVVTAWRRLRPIAGLVLVGYGLLIVLRVLAHDAMLAGAASILLGALLLIPGLPQVHVRRRRLVAALGAGAVAGVLGYNLITRSGLGAPELGLLVYGALLLVASRHLDLRIGRTSVASLVGWSFPLLLAPLLLFAINAVLSGPAATQTGTAAGPIIHHTLVRPMAFGLTLFGSPTEVIGNNVILQTSRGSLTLGVGLVCAGLYPMILFMGVLALHGWQTGLRPGRFAAYLGVGLIGLWLANLARLVLLAKIGQRWGGDALQTAHAHLGWILFAAFMALFWAVVLRRIEPARSQAAA